MFNICKLALISLFSLNCQSAKSKAIHGIITDLVIEHDIEILAISETWLTDNESDHIYLKAPTPPGYELFNVPRGGGDPHSGIAVLYKDSIKVVSKSSKLGGRYIRSFEGCEVIFSTGTKCFTLIVIYHPPPSVKNQLTSSIELNGLLVKYIKIHETYNPIVQQHMKY